MIQREDLADSKPPAPIPEQASFCARSLWDRTVWEVSLVHAESGKLLLFVNSLRTATLVSRVSSAIENSWLVTDLVTVNGNMGGEGPEFFPLKGKHRENVSVNLRLVCRSA